MDYQNDRTSVGRFMYSLQMTFSKFLCRHMWLWYLLNLTWGLPYTVIGAWIALFVKLFLKPGTTRYADGKVTCMQFGNNWGGLEGVFFIFVANNMGDAWTEHTKQHELGHSFQNALFGPLNIFVTLIPSVIRYWVFNFRSKKSKINKAYDLIWFEGAATDAGSYYIDYLSMKEV